METEHRSRGGLGGLGGMAAAFGIWGAHLSAIYGFTALACMRGVAGMDLFGMELVPLGVLAMTAVALLAEAGVLATTLAGRIPPPALGDDPRRFLRWFTVLAALAAMLGILWNGLPALLVPACA